MKDLQQTIRNLTNEVNKIKEVVDTLSDELTKVNAKLNPPQADDGEERNDIGTKINSDVVVKKSIELSRVVDFWNRINSCNGSILNSKFCDYYC